MFTSCCSRSRAGALPDKENEPPLMLGALPVKLGALPDNEKLPPLNEALGSVPADRKALGKVPAVRKALGSVPGENAPKLPALNCNGVHVSPTVCAPVSMSSPAAFRT